VDFGQETFLVEKTSIKYLDQDIGKDWAVFKLKSHPKLRQFPGELFGFFSLSSKAPLVGEKIMIAGFGEDERQNQQHSYELQIAQGSVLSVEHDLFGPLLTHDVDTMGGNSGSAIMRVQDQTIIGVHTHNGCGSTFFGGNMGTLLSKNAELQRAITSCQK
jgi:hypothetical protein